MGVAQAPRAAVAGLPARPAAGLCDSCAHQQLVPNTRGSVFSLCRRSRTEPERYLRYPRLPVTRCEGWEKLAVDGESTGTSGVID